MRNKLASLVFSLQIPRVIVSHLPIWERKVTASYRSLATEQAPLKHKTRSRNQHTLRPFTGNVEQI